MIYVITYILLGILLLMLLYLSFRIPALEDAKKEQGGEKISALLEHAQNMIYAGILLTLLASVFCTWFFVRGTPWESHLMEWLNIVVRVMHFTFGIAWIGASFYFVFLENALNRTEGVREELAGNLWAIHGGGFYYLEKYKVAPAKIPKHLHWFKYEAYFTWISGISLLFIVYYFNASALMIDKNVLDIGPASAIALGIGSFVIAWLIYDLLCRSVLIKYKIAFAITGLILLTAFAWMYSMLFSARAAYIHFGAMIGSLMVANVFFVIIPSQKAMVNAARLGKPVDPQKGKNALARSLHNNYFTLPVLFVMVSNHFPSTFGYRYPWLTLALITLGAAGIKHYLNLREKKQQSYWVMPISAIILLSAAFISAPDKNPEACKSKVSITEVMAIIQKRCSQCHSSRPTDDVYKVAPNGVKYDTPDDLVKKKDLIMQRVVLTKTMPQNNKTNITEEERKLLRCWIEQGAGVN